MQMLISFMNEVNIICESVLASENGFLVHSLRSIYSIRDRTTGEVVLGEPHELFLITLRFRNRMESINKSASATAASLQKWRETEMDSKSQYLALQGAKTSLANNAVLLAFNVTAIVLAAALSFFFLVAADPLGAKKRGWELEARLQAVERDKATAEQAVARLTQQVDSVPAACVTPGAPFR
jgi:hypothetical protein